MSEMQITKEYLLKLVSAVVNGEAVPSVPLEVNAKILYNLAMKNRVSVIFYFAFKDNKDALPPEIFSALEKSYRASMMREISQDEELKFIKNIFSDNNIDFMLLKGCHLKKLYPDASMRFMVDMDVLVRKNDVERAKEIILSRGFSQEMNNGKDIVLIKKPFLTIELHNTLFVEEDEMYPYFLKVWDRAVCLHERELSMTDSDLYIYVMAHLAEHYKEAGSCFRPVMDIYMLCTKFTQSLDFNYINQELKKLNISDFADNIKKLAFCIFDGSEKDEILSMMENYIVLGPPVKNAGIALQNAAQKKSKLHRLFNYAFPGYKHMCLLFPVLNKYPFLLPWFYIVRGFNFIFKERDYAQKKLTALNDVTDNETQIMNDILKKSGLK